ncbi:MAG: nitroreductase family protein [Candidatus Aminicenantes bacterium]|nr:MAG: nitroreductase family protein [Candidatus Aminicenantes bacterium]
MSSYELMLSRRSIRQFKPDPISRDILEKLVNSARLAPSGANLQPLEFVVIDDEGLRRKLFACLRWAAYIAPEGNPKPGCEPVAYVVILVNVDVRKNGYERDVGAAVENMILAAWEERIGSCWIGNADLNRIQKMLKIPGNYKVDCVLALGYPDEDPIIEEMKDSVKYWKDSKGRLHVPKRRLDDVLHFNGF